MTTTTSAIVLPYGAIKGNPRNHCPSFSARVAPLKAPVRMPNQGNADLDGGQEFVGLARQLQGDLGTTVPLAGESLQPPPPRGHDRPLGPCKEAVEHQQQQDDRDLEDHHFVVPIKSLEPFVTAVSTGKLNGRRPDS
jgi:hypothetical protein